MEQLAEILKQTEYLGELLDTPAQDISLELLNKK